MMVVMEVVKVEEEMEVVMVEEEMEVVMVGVREVAEKEVAMGAGVTVEGMVEGMVAGWVVEMAAD